MHSHNSTLKRHRSCRQIQSENETGDKTEKRHTSSKVETLARLSHQKRKRKSHIEGSDNKSYVFFFLCMCGRASTSTTSGSIPFGVYINICILLFLKLCFLVLVAALHRFWRWETGNWKILKRGNRSMKTEVTVQKWNYGNEITEVRRKAAYWCLVPSADSWLCVEAF